MKHEIFLEEMFEATPEDKRAEQQRHVADGACSQEP
jgi:hypothetical protein